MPKIDIIKSIGEDIKDPALKRNYFSLYNTRKKLMRERGVLFEIKIYCFLYGTVARDEAICIKNDDDIQRLEDEVRKCVHKRLRYSKKITRAFSEMRKALKERVDKGATATEQEVFDIAYKTGDDILERCVKLCSAIRLLTDSLTNIPYVDDFIKEEEENGG